MVFDIISEPVSETYRRLLAACHRYSSSAMLVIRDPDDLSPPAFKLMDRLHSWCVREERRSEWPGTVIINFVATVYTYRFDLGLLTKLQHAATGLYQWVQPELPEDPCLLRQDGTPMLVTIAHERDAYLIASQLEANELLVTVPGLVLSRRK